MIVKAVSSIILFTLLAICLTVALNYQLSAAIFPGFNFYDIKRLLELAVLVISAGLGLVIPSWRTAWLQIFLSLPELARHALAAVLLLGLASSLLAQHPQYALLELSLFVLLFYFALLLAGLRQQNAEQFDRYLIGVIVLSTLVYSLTFYSDYFHLLLSNKRMDQYPGFVNIRFFAQYQIWTMPLITLPLLYLQQRFWRALVMLIAMIWWSILWTQTAKGMLVGLLVAYVAALLIWRKRCWQWLRPQLWAAIGGGALYAVLFHVVNRFWAAQHIIGKAAYSKQIANHPAVINVIQTLPGKSIQIRWQLWRLAWGYIKAHPWLGLGPMHFAANYNGLAAHPHNAILLLATEWGLPATFLLLGVFILAAVAWLRQSKVKTLGIALSVSALAGLIYAMVSGILVMPLVQLMFVLVFGWLAALYYEDRENTSSSCLVSCIYFSILTLAVLTLILLTSSQLTDLIARQIAWGLEHKMHYNPRFWLQGWL